MLVVVAAVVAAVVTLCKKDTITNEFSAFHFDFESHTSVSNPKTRANEPKNTASTESQ